MVFSLVTFSCSVKEVQAQHTAAALQTEHSAKMDSPGNIQTDAAPRASLEKLSAFGFYFAEKPIELPEMTIPALAGGSVSNKDFIGKITLLNFWASWCPPCRSEMPSIERLHHAMNGTDFQIVAVNVGERSAQVADFISKSKYTFPIYLDESNRLSSAFASRGIPVTYIINKEGQMTAMRTGAMEFDHPGLITLFKELADE